VKDLGHSPFSTVIWPAIRFLPVNLSGVPDVTIHYVAEVGTAIPNSPC